MSLPLGFIFTMRFHTNNPEKKDKTQLLFFMKAAIAGMVLSGLLIITGIGVKAGLLLLIKYWYFALAAIVGIVLVKKFLSRKK